MLTREPGVVIGWDIGGVNTKVALVSSDGRLLAVRGRPYEIQRDPAALVPLLRELSADVGADAAAQTDAVTHAVTMTAELSQMFRTKRDGVAFVLDAVNTAFPSSVVRVFAVDGRFLAPDEARRQPLAVAAANWAATAHADAQQHADALLVDIGTTSTDIIPIAGGAVVAAGRTDPERLASGELVYTGAVRTPAEAIASHVPFGAGVAGVSAEGFALAGDVHVWRGSLAPADYTSPTPDGRPATREFARERLARVVCADREMLDEAAVSSIADALADAQVERIADAIRRVHARHPSIRTAVVTGLGTFLADAAARAAGLDVTHLSAELGDAAARCAPAVSVALLLAREIEESVRLKPDATRTIDAPETVVASGFSRTFTDSSGVVETVVKLGGGVLANPEHLETALAAIVAAARDHRLLVVPGGGPFADAVRDADRRLRLDDATAHWMAVLAVDQYAYLLAARLTGGVVVTRPHEIAAAFNAKPAGQIPVLAPYRWLHEADPLPHSWDVTSDSIAAWVAGALGVRRLVLIKPPRLRLPDQTVGFGGAAPEATGDGVVDAYFARALPPQVTSVIVPADHVDALEAALRA